MQSAIETAQTTFAASVNDASAVAFGSTCRSIDDDRAMNLM